MANGHGGARRGSGRATAAIREVRESAREAADRQLCEYIPNLIQNMLVLADGVTVQKDTLAGPVIYTEPPDRAANEYLINRVMGKPTEKTEADVNLQGGVTIYLPSRTPD